MFERGSYESSKQLIPVVDNFVRRKAVRNDYGNTPSTVFKSKLLELMLGDCAKTGVIVVNAPSGYGKSIAAKTILQYSPGGIMFRNCMDEITSYSQGMAVSLGVPRSVYEETTKWKNLLIDAVAAVNKPIASRSREDSWLDKVLHKMTSICAPDNAIVSDDLNETLHLDFDDDCLRKLRKRETGILVLDDFDNASDNDIEFMRSFYRIADGAGVLVFVLVRDVDTAGKLLSLNGWYRLAPLKGICTDAKGLPLGRDGKVPSWSVPTWTRDMLIKLLQTNVKGITDTHLARLDIRDGLEPNDLLIQAKELLQEDD